MEKLTRDAILKIMADAVRAGHAQAHASAAADKYVEALLALFEHHGLKLLGEELTPSMRSRTKCRDGHDFLLCVEIWTDLHRAAPAVPWKRDDKY